MTNDETMVIIGTGRAGTQAAMTLREEGFAGRVVLVGEDPEPPYDRVTLSKHYLYGKPGFHGLHFHDPAFYTEHGIEWQRDSRVAAIDLARGQLLLGDGTRQHYDKLLLATGVAARRWDGPGAELPGVHYLRTLADARQLRGALNRSADRGGSVAVIGTGWIGCEVAAAAWELGLSVSLIGRDRLPLAKRVGPEIGEFFRRAHAQHGIELYLGTGVAALHGSDEVQAVELSDGRRVAADVVVVGIGASPRTELAVAAGIDVASAAQGGGIVTDEHFRTSADAVFAAGDVANVPNAALGRRVRLEHYAIAQAQGRAAARAMLGVREVYAQVPFFFSDQFDIWMEATGAPADGDDFVLRNYPGRDRFIAFWLRDGRLAAGMNINIKGVPAAIEALVEAGRPVDRDRLADPNVPLAQTLTAQ